MATESQLANTLELAEQRTEDIDINKLLTKIELLEKRMDEMNKSTEEDEPQLFEDSTHFFLIYWDKSDKLSVTSIITGVLVLVL